MGTIKIVQKIGPPNHSTTAALLVLPVALLLSYRREGFAEYVRQSLLSGMDLPVFYYKQ